MSKPFEYAAGNRERAWQIMRVALDAVEPGAAVRRHLHLVANHLTIMDPQGGEHVHALDEFDRVLVVGCHRQTWAYSGRLGHDPPYQDPRSGTPCSRSGRSAWR
jgi:hypothetical protein